VDFDARAVENAPSCGGRRWRRNLGYPLRSGQFIEQRRPQDRSIRLAHFGRRKEGAFSTARAFGNPRRQDRLLFRVVSFGSLVTSLG